MKLSYGDRKKPEKAWTEEKEEQDAVAFARARLGFEPDEKQALVLGSEARRGILNCCRQWGKSTVLAIKALHFAWTREDSLVVVASPSARQSGEFVRKVRGFLRQLGVKPRGDGYHTLSVLLPNGARVVGLPGREDTVRGFSKVGMLLVDEAARAGDDLYTALRAMLATTGGALWLLSTPMGQRGFFWREWSQGQGWLKVEAKAEECGRYAAEFLEMERGSMEERLYRQEYGCEFAGAEGQWLEDEVIDGAFWQGVEKV